MENALKNLNEPTDEDMEGIEVLYNSLFKTNSSNDLHTINQTELHLIENEDVPDKKLLNMIIEKCFNKIRTDRINKEKYLKELDETQHVLKEFHEENMNLKEIQKDLTAKIEQLHAFIDKTEEINDDLEQQVALLKHQNQEYIISKERKKLLAKSQSLHFERKEESLISQKRLLEIENLKNEISVLKETINVQEQLISKLENEVCDYQNIGTKHEQLKSLVHKILHCEEIEEEIDPQLAEFAEKLKFYRQSISVQSGNKENSNSKDQIRRSIFTEKSSSYDSEDELNNKNIRATRNSLSFNEIKFSPFRRQKSLAEDLMGVKRNELTKETSPQSVYIANNRNYKQDTKSTDYTRESQEYGRYSKNTERTFSTFDGIEKDSFTPEFQSPVDEAGPDGIFRCVEVLDQDQEEDQNKIDANETKVEGWYEGDIINLGMSITRRLESSKSKDSNDKEEIDDLRINILKKSANKEIIFENNIERVVSFEQNKESTLVISSSVSQTEIKLEELSIKNISFQRVREDSQKKRLQPNKDMSRAMRRYVRKERNNAIQNTSFSFFKLLSLFIFGP